jgi:hypothetical protein
MITNITNTNSTADNHTCKLIDGSIHHYDAASKRLDYYDDKVFKFIGCGIIDTIYGKDQNYHFDKIESLEYFYIYR